MIKLGRVESSKKTILSLVIYRRVGFFLLLFYAPMRNRDIGILILPLFSLNFFRISRVFWNLYDVDVTGTLFLVPPVRMDWTRGVELQGILDTLLSFNFLSISGRGCSKLLQYYLWCEECGVTQYWGAGSHVLPSLVSL